MLDKKGKELPPVEDIVPSYESVLEAERAEAAKNELVGHEDAKKVEDLTAPKKRGRPKGIHTKQARSRDLAYNLVQDHVRHGGAYPMEYLMEIAAKAVDEFRMAEKHHNDKLKIQYLSLALDAASRAAPYVHPKLNAIDLGDADGEKLNLGGVLVVPNLVEDVTEWSEGNKK